jgi:thiol-disulfide isomerase/thioredoxin
MKKVSRIITGFYLLLVMVSPVCSSDPGILGLLAPHLRVPYWFDAEGNPLKDDSKLLDWKGKVIYILCWQSWCPGCHSSGFPTLKKLSSHFNSEPGIQFLSIQTVFEGHKTNSLDRVPETMAKYGLKVPSGHDPGSKYSSGVPNTMRDYRTGGTPWVIIISKSGRVVFNGFNVDPDKAIPALRRLIEEPL